MLNILYILKGSSWIHNHNNRSHDSSSTRSGRLGLIKYKEWDCDSLCAKTYFKFDQQQFVPQTPFIKLIWHICMPRFAIVLQTGNIKHLCTLRLFGSPGLLNFSEALVQYLMISTHKCLHFPQSLLCFCRVQTFGAFLVKTLLKCVTFPDRIPYNIVS